MIKDGWLHGALPCLSPNFDARPEGIDVDLLVIHNISLPPDKFSDSIEAKSDIISFFLNHLPVKRDPFYHEITSLKVSTHFFITRQGFLWQLVSTKDRAWHAGASTFGDRSACNDFSIGVELEGSDHCAFTLTQYQQLAKLTQKLRVSYPKISHDRIVGHSDIAPARKTDPGPHFDWVFYRQLMEGLL